MRLTDQKWDNLKFSKDKNVSGSKSTEYVKICKFIIGVCRMYICGENQKKCKKYYDTQVSGYFWKERRTRIRKGYIEGAWGVVKFP